MKQMPQGDEIGGSPLRGEWWRGGQFGHQQSEHSCCPPAGFSKKPRPVAYGDSRFKRTTLRIKDLSILIQFSTAREARCVNPINNFFRIR